MKKTILAFVFGLILFVTNSCKKTIDKLTEFDIPYTSNATIPVSTFNTTVAATAPFDIKTPDIPTNASSNFSTNKTSADLISEIKMTKLELSVASGNLDFIKSVSVSISGTGLSEVLIATKDVFPTGASSTTLDMKDVNIKDYIKKDNISFRVQGVVQTSTTQIEQTIKLDEITHVKATLIK